MVTSIVVLSPRIQNTKMRSSTLIIKMNAQKQKVVSIFGRKFHDFNYFEFYFPPHIP